MFSQSNREAPTNYVSLFALLLRLVWLKVLTAVLVPCSPPSQKKAGFRTVKVETVRERYGNGNIVRYLISARHFPTLPVADFCSHLSRSAAI